MRYMLFVNLDDYKLWTIELERVGKIGYVCMKVADITDQLCISCN